MRTKQGWRARATGFIAATMLGSMTLSGVAYADDIYNTIDGTIDVTAEQMPLNVGGPNGATTLRLDPTNEVGGENGCNIQGGERLVLALSSSNTSVATVTPPTVTFTNCGGVIPITVVPGSIGEATITAAASENTTGGKFDLRPATFIVTVSAPAPANTVPSVSVAGVTGGAAYAKGSVPAATCQVTDAEDGNSSFAAALSAITGTYASDGIGSQTAICSYTDGGGLTASSSVTYNIVDPSAPTIAYVLNPTGPDGDNDWYRSDVTLTWNVSDPQSPGSVAKTGCDNQSITVDQVATTYSCSATSAGGSAGPVSVSIKRDAKAPVVSDTAEVNGTEGLNGWYTSDVDVSFTASDALSGPASQSETVKSADEGSAVVVESPAFTDAAGNTVAAGDKQVTLKIDKQAPNPPKAVLTPAPNGDGWNKSDVTVKFEADGDNGPSGNVTCSTDVSVTAETAGEDVSGTCTDEAGNVSSATTVKVKLDKTGPVITSAVVGGTEGNNGWYTTPVTVRFSASDALSGLADGTISPEDVVTTAEGASVEVQSSTFTDRAGNSSGPLTRSFKVDRTKPTNLQFVGGPRSEEYYGYVPANASCTAEDAVSGLASCVVTGYSTEVGEHTLTATATDNAGNKQTATRKYTVAHWTTKGFFAPVDIGKDAKGNPIINTVKGGSTVPLKFEVFAGATELTDVGMVKSFTVGKAVGSDLVGTEDAIEVTSTGGTSLRYDATGGQFIQNWQTPKTSNVTYRVTVTLQDGSSISALFRTK